jgi:hypothetical protein
MPPQIQTQSGHHNTPIPRMSCPVFKTSLWRNLGTANSTWYDTEVSDLSRNGILAILDDGIFISCRLFLNGMYKVGEIEENAAKYHLPPHGNAKGILCSTFLDSRAHCTTCWFRRDP